MNYIVDSIILNWILQVKPDNLAKGDNLSRVNLDGIYPPIQPQINTKVSDFNGNAHNLRLDPERTLNFNLMLLLINQFILW